MTDYAFYLVVLSFQLTGPEQCLERQIRWHDKCVSIPCHFEWNLGIFETLTD